MIGHWFIPLLARVGEPVPPQPDSGPHGSFGGGVLASATDKRVELENLEVLQLLLGVFAMDEVFA